MIIVEGADASGKTTVARMIACGFGYTYIHSPGPINYEETIKERLYWYDSLLPIKKIILDRCYLISELIYGPIIRNNTRTTYKELCDFLKRFNLKKGMLIFCDQQFSTEFHYPQKTIHVSHEDRKELESMVQDNLQTIRVMYRELMRKIARSYLFHYYEIKNIDDYSKLFETVKEFYDERKRC